MAKKDDSPDDTPLPVIDPWEVMSRIADALTGIKEKIAGGNDSSRNQEMLVGLSAALQRLAETNIEGSKLIASETRRAHRPSNEIAPGISVFNRRGLNLPEDATGVRKPLLKCLMMIPWLVEWESITREEAELLNLIEAGEYTLRRIDDSTIRVSVQMEYRVDGKPSRMLINHDTGFNNDNFRLVPRLADYLRQLLRQHDSVEIKRRAAAVLSDQEEADLIEAGELSVST